MKFPIKKIWIKKIAGGFLCAIFLFSVLQYGYLKILIGFKIHPPAAAAKPFALEEVRLPPDTLFIPSIEVTAPILSVEDKTEWKIQEALKGGVVHYPGTAQPGEPGNAFIVGHSSDYVRVQNSAYRHIFALLPELKIGAQVFATDHEGRLFQYLVRYTRIVSPGNFGVLEQNDGKASILTLQTSYPLGTALKRYLVVSELVPSSADGLPPSSVILDEAKDPE